MRPITISVGPLAAAVANSIVLSQSLASAGALTLNGSYVSGGVATLPQARRVGIVSAGNDSGITWTITGTNWSGQPISETLAGGNIATAQSVLDYLTVSSIIGSGATASTVTAGTTAVAGSAWLRLDEWALGSAAYQANVSGTVNYTVQMTLDDPNSISNAVVPASVTWVPAISSQTAVAQGALSIIPAYVQVVLNSGTGSVALTVSQLGVAPL
jgi:hypothetical protein